MFYQDDLLVSEAQASSDRVAGIFSNIYSNPVPNTFYPRSWYVRDKAPEPFANELRKCCGIRALRVC